MEKLQVEAADCQHSQLRNAGSRERSWVGTLVPRADLRSPGHLIVRKWQEEVSAIPFVCITDSKSLFDAVKKDTNPASQCEDKHASIDISLIKQKINELSGTIRWVDGRTMLADCLTKDTKGDYLRQVIKDGKWSILEEGSALQQKLRERQHDMFFFAPFDQHKMWSVHS